jgi:hypothetical protein
MKNIDEKTENVREWWIDFNGPILDKGSAQECEVHNTKKDYEKDPNNEYGVHVVEYSAYESLKSELEKAHGEIEKLKKQIKNSIDDRYSK